MGKGKGRYKNNRIRSDVKLDRQGYFDKHIKPQRTAEKYLMALRLSPFNIHRRAAKVLQGELKGMKQEHDELIKEYAYDSTGENPDSGTDDQSNTGSEVC